jgi:ATP phosphoribosyltransferase regulatory subunit
LCYADNVLHTRPQGLLTSRVPIRIGAELFGHAGVACDIELIVLMAETLRLAGIAPVHIVLGHVGIYRSLINAAGLSAEAESELFDAVQRKAFAETDVWLKNNIADDALSAMLKTLSRLSGDRVVLNQAETAFATAPAPVRQALADLRQISDAVTARINYVSLGFDLSELRGYQYHTGIVFAAYTPSHGRAIAKGGRYNDIGKVFGRARPASGFDADLKILAGLSARPDKVRNVILAPDKTDAALQALVKRLRSDGETVVTHLGDIEPDEVLMRELSCSRSIVYMATSGWQVVEL